VISYRFFAFLSRPGIPVQMYRDLLMAHYVLGIIPQTHDHRLRAGALIQFEKLLVGRGPRPVVRAIEQRGGRRHGPVSFEFGFSRFGA